MKLEAPMALTRRGLALGSPVGDGTLADDIEMIYSQNEGSDLVEEYHQRQGIKSMLILTVADEKDGLLEAAKLSKYVKGKTVVEIGSGTGVLAIALAQYAKMVYAFEADPAWSWCFIEHLYRKMPSNLLWIFGNAEHATGMLRADVAIIYSRSGQENMKEIARKMAPVVLCPFENSWGG